MTAEEAKKIVNEKVDNQLAIIHSAIDAMSKLGFRCLMLDNWIARVHPRTIKVLRDEGFTVTVTEKIITPDNKDCTVYIDWH